MLNVKGGVLVRASIPYPGGLAVGDLNGDSRQDIAVTSSGADTVSVLVGNGDGTLRAASPLPFPDDPVSVVVGTIALARGAAPSRPNHYPGPHHRPDAVQGGIAS